MTEEEVTIVVPEGMIPDTDVLSGLIVASLRVIAKACGDNEDYLKYGADFENDVFRMHPFCWCEKEDCIYCKDEDPAPNFHHKESGLSVWWYKYIGRSTEIKGPINAFTVLDIIRECLKSIPG